MKEKTKTEEPAKQEEQTNEDAKEQKASDKTVELKASDHQQLIKEAAEYKDKYVRLYAEFDNARKRMERDQQEFVKYANEELIVRFLNILDDLERIVQAAQIEHDKDEAFIKGIEMVMAHIYDMLKKNGVVPIEVKNKTFDPHYHEILMQEETERDDGVILEEFQKGYLLHDKVIRTAKVKIAKQKDK
jgi:molecular chaperone GrpE